MTALLGWDFRELGGSTWTDLFATYARRSPAFAGDPHLVPPWRGDDDLIPGRRGRTLVESTIDAGKVQIGFTLRGANSDGTVATDMEAALLDNWRDLKRRLYRPGGFELRRRLRYPEGVASHWCPAAKILPGSMTPDLASTFHGRVLLDVGILSGTFYDESTTTIHAGTSTVGGDVETGAIFLALPGAGTLTNVTLGISVTVTTACTIDVPTFGVSAGLSTLTHSDMDRLFALAAGSNVITWSAAGTVDVVYRAAHL